MCLLGLLGDLLLGCGSRGRVGKDPIALGASITIIVLVIRDVVVVDVLPAPMV